MSHPINHVYADKPDERVAKDAIAPSRFRPQYRALSADEKKLHDDIKAAAVVLEDLLMAVPNDACTDTPAALRYRALSLTALEESVMWAVKGLTA